MSTKIYNGWRIDGVSLDELLVRMVKFGKACRTQAREWACNLITSLSVKAIDTWVVRRGKTDVWFDTSFHQNSVLNQYMWWVDQRITEALTSSSRDPFFDIGCDVSIHPVTDKGKPTILLLLYCEHSSKYEKLWKRIVKAKPFEYFDNSDRLDGVSEKEWVARGKLWEKALPYSSPPVENGYGFSCTTSSSVNFFSIGAEDFLDVIPSDEHRIEAATWDWAMDIALKRRLKKLTKQHKVQDWLRDNKAGKKLVATCRAKVKARLPKITYETLCMDSRKILVQHEVKTK